MVTVNWRVKINYLHNGLSILGSRIDWIDSIPRISYSSNPWVRNGKAKSILFGIPTPGPVDIRYHLPDSSENYVLMLKIHLIDGSSKSTMKKHQMSLACMAILEGFSTAKSAVAEINGTCVVQRAMSLATENGESKDMWLGCTKSFAPLTNQLNILTHVV